MLTLDQKGILLSLLLGAFIFFFGGLNPFIMMWVFLISAVFVTRFGYYEKKELGLYEYERGWKNVVSNGLVPAIMIFLFPENPIPFLCSLAAIASDKFASELGIFERSPIDLFTLRKTKAGKSGAVSFLGLFASIVGAVIIAMGAFLIYSLNFRTMLLITVAGFVGSFFDSIAGILEEKGIGTKETSNIIGSLAGAVIGVFA